MTKRHASTKTWRLAVGTAKAAAGKGWRGHLKRWVGESHPSPLRKIYDRDGGPERQQQIAADMRKMLDRAHRDLDAEYLRRRAELDAGHRAIEMYAAEAEFIRKRDARGPDGSDEIFAAMLADLQPMENA